MKKLLLFLVAMGFVQPVMADMCYDIANNILFSVPESDKINPYTYHRLCYNVIQIYSNAKIYGKNLLLEIETIQRKEAQGGVLSSDEENYFQELLDEEDRVINYIDDYLKSMGSPESLRLLADLQKHRMKKIEYKVCKNFKKFKKPCDLPPAFRG